MKRSELRRKLAAYVVGSAGAAAMVNSAQAGVIITDIEQSARSANKYLGIDSFSDGAASVSINAATPSTDNIRFYGGSFGTYLEGEVNGQVQVQFLFQNNAGRRAAINLDVGDSVSGTSGTATSDFVDIANTPNGFESGFAQDVRDYTGFQLLVDGRTHFGWLDFTVTADQGLTIHRIAIETDQNVAALVSGVAPTDSDPGNGSMVPEPTTATVFALGATGLAFLRRRRPKLQSAE